MLFGSAAVMTSMTTLWEEFYLQLQEYVDLSVHDAVNVLREVFGKCRPVLILVDEIAKAECSENEKKAILSELGACLDMDRKY
jgi:hypothetical protein